jgi:hypothetical protein
MPAGPLGQRRLAATFAESPILFLQLRHPRHQRGDLLLLLSNDLNQFLSTRGV